MNYTHILLLSALFPTAPLFSMVFEAVESTTYDAVYDSKGIRRWGSKITYFHRTGPFVVNLETLPHCGPVTTTYENPLNNPAIYKEKSLATLTSLLAEKKYDVEGNKENSEGSPLKIAISAKNSNAVMLLLKNGANPNQIINLITQLCWCISFGTPEITELLLQNGANPNLATLMEHPLFVALNESSFNIRELRIIAILLRAGLNPITAQQLKINIFQSMSVHFKFISKSKEAPYKKAGRALVRYKVLWNHLHRNWGLPAEIVQHVLTFVDFGLDDYHIPLAECTICYDEKKFSAIPCSKNSHTDSICSDCLGKITDCPLCREKLK